jgi:hypothetical protein
MLIALCTVLTVSGNPAVGGISYGSVYRPTETGSAGGGPNAGHGGGKVKVRVPAEFLLDGYILVDGTSGTAGAGGGSGGSVLIESGKMCCKLEHYLLSILFKKDQTVWICR